MPGYLNMPAIWSAELTKKIAGEITTDVIFDVDGINPIHLNGRIWVKNIETISIKNELDVNWSMRPTLSDLKIEVIDQNEFFNIKNPDSPFFLAFGILTENAVAGQNYIKISNEIMAGFSAGNIITISDGTNSQTLVIKLATTVASSRYLYFYDNLNYSFSSANTYVLSEHFEEKKVVIDLRINGSLQPYRIFTGSILNLPEFNNKQATFTITDLRKRLMDSPVIGADSDSSNKLMIIDSSGNLVNSIHWKTGIGNLDRTKITVHDACRLGKWTIKFDTATSYSITGPGITEQKSTLIDTINSISNANKVTGLSEPVGVTIKDNKAYICDRISDAFYIYDISNINNILLLDSITDGTNLNGCRACVVTENYAYVISDSGRSITTIDISNATNISIVNAQVAQSNLNDCMNIAMDAEKEYLYISSYTNSSFSIYDIKTNPAHPLLVNEISGVGSPKYLGGAYDLKVCGDRLYVSAYDDSYVTVWNIAYRDDPTIYGAQYIEGAVAGIDVVNNIVYACVEGYDKLAIYDFSDYYNITLLDSISGSGSPNYLDNIHDVKVIGNFAFCLGSTDDSLAVIDCSDKSNIALETVIYGAGSPNYLQDAVALDVAGDKIVVLAPTDGAISCFSLSIPNDNDLVTDQLTIPISAWSGEINAGDELEFWTGINFNDINVIQALYNVYIKKISNQYLDCSSFFGDKQIGTLYMEHNSGATTLLIRNIVPVIIPEGDELTIIEGTVTEDVTVQTSGGNDEATSFPPYISLTVSALANNYTSAAIVIWKQRSSLNNNYSFDREYSYCYDNDINIKFTAAKEMNYQQLILLILAHSNSINFQSNYGVEMVTTLRQESTSGVPVLAYNTNLKKLEVETFELTNKFIADYQFNYLEDKYNASLAYPGDDTKNQSYLKHGFLKQADTIKLPGFLTSDLVTANLEQKYSFYQNGFIIYKADVTLQGLNLPIGSVVKLESLYPNISTYAKIMGYEISIDPYNIRLTLLDIKHLL